MQPFKNESYSQSLDRENTELSKRLNRYHEIQKYHFDFNCEKAKKKRGKNVFKISENSKWYDDKNRIHVSLI